MKMARIESFTQSALPLGVAGIERRSLHDELLERLRDLIVQGGLEPGSKVPERELCERFGVSRTPMREALKVLASEGLVALRPNRGAVVSALTASELEEAHPVMAALEKLSGELAVSRITEQEVDQIRSLHALMVQHYQRHELKPYLILNEQIHNAILAAARNPTLTTIHGGLSGRLRRARYLTHMSADRWARAIAEHELILDALDHRKPELGQILQDHLTQKIETIREALLA